MVYVIQNFKLAQGVGELGIFLEHLSCNFLLKCGNFTQKLFALGDVKFLL